MGLIELLVLAYEDAGTNDNENKALAIKPLIKCVEVFETGNR